MPKLTIGMATFDQYEPTYFTVQSLRMHHAEAMPDVELLVVDNNPGGKDAKLVKNLLENKGLAHGTAGVRYIPMASPIGTTAPRQRIFDEARGDAVMCIDSHVILPPGTVGRLIRYFDENPDSRDLLGGPLLYDNYRWPMPTHFADQWRSHMWGTWASMWSCACGKLKFDVREGLDGNAEFCAPTMGRWQALPGCDACGCYLPIVKYPGHEPHLAARNFKLLTEDIDGPPFEIPGQGLGLFACRKAAWPGFNPHFRQFGGEEMYIHEKFRQRGDRALCLPFLRWGHMFGRPDGVKYPISQYAKVRNYVLGHLELGLPLDRVHAHFVSREFTEPTLALHLEREHGVTRQATQEHPDRMEFLHGKFKMEPWIWEHLIADPVKHENPPTPDKAIARAVTGNSIEEFFDKVCNTPRDLDKHLPTLRALAEQCEHVTEFSKRRESLIAFAAARPAKLVSHNVEQDATAATIRGWALVGVHMDPLQSPDVETIEPTDLLFIDSQHTKARLAEELAKYGPAVRRWIVMHDTQLYRNKGEDNGPGLVEAIRDYCRANPEWFVSAHTPEQHGLTILSREPIDRPEQPVHLWPVGKGPGTELKAIMASIGINPSASCDCNGKAEKMDQWGVAKCREERETIANWLREGAPRWKWTEKLAAGAAAIATGLAFQVNWADPFPGLIDEAIRRAEAIEKHREAADQRLASGTAA